MTKPHFNDKRPKKPSPASIAAAERVKAEAAYKAAQAVPLAKVVKTPILKYSPHVPTAFEREAEASVALDRGPIVTCQPRPSIIIVVPLPPHELNPNGRAHWAAKARAVKLARKQAHDAAMMVLLKDWGDGGLPWKRASLRAVFYFPDKRGLKSDTDNLIASLKATADGIADAGVIENDRGFAWMTLAKCIDPETPRVVLEITEIKENGQ